MLSKAIVLSAICLLLLTFGTGQMLAQKDVDPPGILTLEDSVRLALINNLNLLSTIDVLQSAHIYEQVAASRFNLKLTPSYARGVGEQSIVDQRFGMEVSRLLPFGATISGNYRTDMANNQFGTFNNSNLTVGVTQPLLRGFGKKVTQFELENSRRGVEGAQRNFELARQRLVVEVVASYFNIIRQEGLLDVAQNSHERNKELLRASEARLEVGLASKLDVFRAELQLSQAQEVVILREEALDLAVDGFKFNLGLGPLEQISLAKVDPGYQPVDINLENLTRLALENRVEVQEERDRVRDAQRSVAISKQNLLPQLDLNVRYEQRGMGDSFYSSLDFQDRGFNVFLATRYALDRSHEKASFALAQMDVNARVRSLRLLEYNIVNEVRAAARNVERIGKSILLQERSIDFAEKQRRLAMLRYQRALASNFDIIDAENNLIQARSNYVSLVTDHHVAQIELKRVTGLIDIEREFAPGTFMPNARHHP